MDELAPKHYELDRMTAICEALQKQRGRLEEELIYCKELLKDVMNEGYARHTPGCLGAFYKGANTGSEPWPCECGYVEWLEKAKEVTDETD